MKAEEICEKMTAKLTVDSLRVLKITFAPGG
jgi:hypothetical protein